MGQWFSRWTGWLRRRRDPPVEEPVAVRVGTPVRESLSASYDGRISPGGDIPSTVDIGYQDIGLDAESTQRELERRRHTVARFLSGHTTMVPLPDGGHYYILTESFEQLQTDHRHEMLMWYLDQFHEDPDEQMARWAQLDAQGFGGPPVAAEDPEEVAEDDSEEDPEEVAEDDPEEDSMGSDDHVPLGYSPKPIDPEDFDPWDDPASD